MVVDLLKLIPEATSAIAVIIVVILFLKQQEAANESWKTVTKDFTAALESQRKAVVDTIGQHLEAAVGHGGRGGQARSDGAAHQRARGGAAPDGSRPGAAPGRQGPGGAHYSDPNAH